MKIKTEEKAIKTNIVEDEKILKILKKQKKN